MDNTAAPAPPRRKPLISRFHLFPIGVMLAVTATALVKIKSDHSLPVHWGFDGKPDQFWPRDETIAAAPALMIVLLAAFALAGYLLPAGQVEPGRRIWEGLLTFLLGVLCAIQFAFILIGVGSDIDLIRAIAALVALVMLAFGALVMRAPPNVFHGVRLPWGMASSSSWIAAHRASGALTMVCGLALGLDFWFWPTPADLLAGIAAAIGVALLGSIVLSLLLAATLGRRR